MRAAGNSWYGPKDTLSLCERSILRLSDPDRESLSGWTDAIKPHAPDGDQGFPASQLKFFSSSVLPVPEYTATRGKRHIGRVRARAPGGLRSAMRSGARPLSLQLSIVLTASNTNGPSPPPQCPIPGIM